MMVKNIARVSAILALVAFLFVSYGASRVDVQKVSYSAHVRPEVAAKPARVVESAAETLAQIIEPKKAEAKTFKATDPARLVIPKIKVNSRILGMGLTSDGKMAVPSNYVDVGWYKLGAKPGEMGSAVFGAHVDNGGKVPGVFKNLKSLSIGDEIFVTDSNGSKLIYKVTSRKIYNYQEKNTGEVFLANASSKINLITCYGTWLPKKNTYDRRLVVSAELQDINNGMARQ